MVPVLKFSVQNHCLCHICDDNDNDNDNDEFDNEEDDNDTDNSDDNNLEWGHCNGTGTIDSRVPRYHYD